MNKRLSILLASIVVAILAVWGSAEISWSPVPAYLAYAILAVIFFGILVSNQQYEEDWFSKAERFVSAFLFSYIVFFRLLYAPLSQFFFGTLITTQSFFSGILVLILFIIFFFLFGTVFLVLNKYSQVGFLSGWRIFNNEKAFFVLRGMFLAAVVIFGLFYLRNSFFSIKNSATMNKILPAATCDWAYIEYPNFLSTGQSATGRDVCLYNYSQDRYDPEICDRITGRDTRNFCRQYFAPE